MSRIALPEYPSEMRNEGGLGNYLHRFSKLLVSSGHEAEIFVASADSENPQLVG
jgi:hypothetical protein